MVIVAELGDDAVDIWDLKEQFLVSFSNKENGSWVKSSMILCTTDKYGPKQLQNYVYKRYPESCYVKITHI